MGDGPRDTSGADTRKPRRQTQRTGSGRFLKTEESAQRDAQALRLKARGLSLQQISDRLGYGGHANVSRALDRAVQSIVGPDARLYYEQQMLTLDDLTVKVYDILDGEHPLVSDGRVVRDEDGNAYLDPDMTLKATDRLLRILERRAKLLGLDAAIKMEATVHQVDQVDVGLAELIRDARAKAAAATAAVQGQE